MRQKNAKDNNVNNNKKSNRAVKFAAIVFSLVFVFIFIAGMAVLGVMSQSARGNEPATDITGTNNNAQTVSSADDNASTENLSDNVRKRINMLVLGVDIDETRTDLMMLVTFDTFTKKLDIVSIPRDTRIKIPEDRLDILRDVSRFNYLPNSEGVIKINEVHSYAGKELGVDFAVKQVEELLDLKIDYYLKLNTKAFRDIIDEIGGVEMTLDRSYYYYDPDQNLEINIKKGHQILYGEAAEGLVRFRKGYAEGDTKRIEVQHEFMTELIDQVLQKETLINNAHGLVAIIIDSVTTNMSLDDALKYVKYLRDLKMENISMYTIPGEGMYIDDVSFYIVDESAMFEMLQEIFYPGTVEKTTEETPKDSKEFRIEILNGAGVKGLAAEKKDILTELGYNVVHIGDYSGTNRGTTMIYVKKSGNGEDLKRMFVGSELVVNKSKVGNDADITIVLGTDETSSAMEYANR